VNWAVPNGAHLVVVLVEAGSNVEVFWFARVAPSLACVAHFVA